MTIQVHDLTADPRRSMAARRELLRQSVESLAPDRAEFIMAVVEMDHQFACETHRDAAYDAAAKVERLAFELYQEADRIMQECP